MPLQIVQLDSKENDHAVQRASHCPLRFTVWTSQSIEQPIPFRHSPFPRKELRAIASQSPTLPHLELLVFEHHGCAVGYLGHPDEYLSNSWKTPTPRFRAKVISASGKFLDHLRQTLRPHILQEMLGTISKRLHLTRKAVDELHRREEEHVRAAHLLMPICAPLHEVPLGRVIPSRK